jgi:hypothetical protein
MEVEKKTYFNLEVCFCYVYWGQFLYQSQRAVF